jgi:hypothetical protein
VGFARFETVPVASSRCELSNDLMKVDKTNGALLEKTLNSVVTRGSAERTAALHKRIAAQSPCKTKEQLLHGLQAWKEDLEELQATGSSPGKETVISSMKLLVSGVRELKTVMEITELLAPGDVRRLCNVVHKKAAEWAVLDSDPRMSGNSHVVNAMAATSGKGDVCRFFAKGTCKRGKDCRFLNENPRRSPPRVLARPRANVPRRARRGRASASTAVR